LFASVLQRSDEPSAGQVRKAVATAMRAYGGRGCAERVAQEFGDHPEPAVARMRWACGVAGEVFAAPGPARDGRRKWPGRPLTRAGQPLPLTRRSTSFTSCTPMGAILLARYTTTSTGQRDTSHQRALTAIRANPARLTAP